MIIRPTIPEDFPQITAIYSHYVLNTIANFEEVPPTEEEIKRRWQEAVSKKLPYLTACEGDNIIGFCYAVPYRVRSGYRYTVEDSVYVAPNHFKKGVGKALLSELIKQCSGYKQMIAVICGNEDTNSFKLHSSLGFKKAGVLENVGFKFDKWIDIVLMQKQL